MTIKITIELQSESKIFESNGVQKSSIELSNVLSCLLKRTKNIKFQFN